MYSIELDKREAKDFKGYPVYSLGEGYAIEKDGYVRIVDELTDDTLKHLKDFPMALKEENGERVTITILSEEDIEEDAGFKPLVEAIV